MKNKHLIIGLIFSSLLMACAAPRPQIPAELQYQQPEQTTNSSTIVGSQENSSWADDYTAYISVVDGKRAMGGRKEWNVPLRISSGKHNISVAFARGSFSAMANIQLDAKAGRAYQVKYATDVAMNGANTYCDFWIADASSGTAVTEISHSPVSGRGGGGTIPIFIPARK